MERVHRGAILGGEGDVRSRPHCFAKADPEECLSVLSVAETVLGIEALDAKRLERLVVERLRAFDVRDADRYVIQHITCSYMGREWPNRAIPHMSHKNEVPVTVRVRAVRTQACTVEGVPW